MPEFHEGGCACAAVRYRVTGKPVRTGVCHCTFWHRSYESQRKLWTQFCPNWTRSRHPWVPLPTDMETFEKSALQQPTRIK